METPSKPMTAREKIRKLVEVKEQAQREAKERYLTDPAYQAIFQQLRQENAERRAKK
jgi:spore coat protein CotH